MGSPPGPPPPPSRLTGTNNLSSQMDVLTRAITGLSMMMRASQGGGGALGTIAGLMGGSGGQFGGVGGTNAHAMAQRRLTENFERQQAQWDMQRSRGQYQLNSGRLTSRQQALVTQRMDYQAINYYTAERRHNEDRATLDRQFGNQQTMNRISAGAAVAGAAIGAAKSYFSDDFAEGAGQYGRRMALLQPGTQTGTVGERAKKFAGGAFGYGLQNTATSNADYFSGTLTINEQTLRKNQDSAMRSAGVNSFVNPSLGVQGAAQMQTEFGTSQAYYAAQQFGLRQQRGPGATLSTPEQMMTSLAQRTFQGRDLSKIGKEDLTASLAQGGSLAISMANYGGAAGLSGQTLEASKNTLLAQAALQRGGMTETQAQDTLGKAAKNDKAGDDARKELAKTDIPELGGSLEDAKKFLAGRSREGHLAMSASFQDAAISSANTLTDIYSLLQKIIPEELLGKLGGAFSQGPLGGIASLAKENPGLTALSMFNPAAAATGWLGKQVSGMFGGANTAGSGIKQGENKDQQKKDPAGSGTAANIGAILGFAREQLGERYSQQNPQGPDHWDCSGLLQNAYAAGGVSIPRVTWDQINAGMEVGMDELQPGDLVFYNDISHVAMYTGNGNIIQSSRPGRPVNETEMDSSFVRARRILTGSVPATGTQDGKTKDPTTGAGMGGSTGVAGFGSVEEVDALAAALGGGGGGGGGGGTWDSATSDGPQQNEEAGRDGGIPPGPDNPTGNKAIGKQMAASYGWGQGPQWDALHELWMRESGWSSTADNPSSDAYGIPQAMSNLYPETGTPEWRGSPERQIDWGLKYIKGRYKRNGPIEAVQFHDANNWYDKGAYDVPGDQMAKLHSGEMVLTKQQATTVRAALMEQGLGDGKGSGGGTVNLSFDQGSINISMPSATPEGAQSAAKSFVDFVAADDRIKSMMGGW